MHVAQQVHCVHSSPRSALGEILMSGVRLFGKADMWRPMPGIATVKIGLSIFLYVRAGK
jgi:hypothetical protein